MKRTRLSSLITAAVLFAPVTAMAQGKQFEPAVSAQLKTRELSAPAAIKTKLESIRAEIKAQKLSFEVAYTEAMDIPLEQLTGLKVPADAAARAQSQMALSAKMLADDAAEVAEHAKSNPGFKAGAAQGLASGGVSASVFNWVSLGKVTPVRNQGGCGSCWVFGTTAAFESSWAIRNNQMIDTSEQDVLSCSKTTPGCGSGTCNGGWMEWVANYLKIKGTGTEASKPYTASNGTCTAIARPYMASAWGFVAGTGLPSVAQLKAALVQHGVLSVGVMATPAFQAYSGGVFNQSTPGLNHCVAIVGWNDGLGAWLIKNSWGTGWGMGGYMWIKYGANGIGSHAVWVDAKATPPAPPAEDCLPFNPSNLKVQHSGANYLVVDGSHSMLAFSNAANAQKAIDTIKKYNYKRICFVGRPFAAGQGMTYFLP